MGKKLKLTSSEKPQRLAGKVYRSPYSRNADDHCWLPGSNGLHYRRGDR